MDEVSTSFRPPLPLLAVLGAIGCACGLASFALLMAAIGSGSIPRTAASALLFLPLLLAAAAFARRVETRERGLRNATLVGRRDIPWASIRRIDCRRASFVIETDRGPVSAGWLAPTSRETLLRLVVEKAGLVRAAEPLPWGVQMRYVPRAQDIPFLPLARRRELQTPGRS